MNNQSFSKIWIVVIIVILLAGGILAWQHWWLPKQRTELTIISCGTGLIYKPCEARYYCEISSDCEKNCQGICKKAESIDISSWQTYQNTKYGFEVKYPYQWKLSDSIEWLIQIYPDKDLIPSEIITEKEKSDLAVTREWPAITIQIFDNPDNLNLREAFNAYLLPELDVDLIKEITKTQEVIQEVKVNNINAITFISPPQRVRVFIISSDSNQLIGVYLPNDEESIWGVTTSQTFNQILSTFKFLE